MARTGTKEAATAAAPKGTVALAGAIVKKKKKTSGVEGVAAAGVEKKPLKAKKPASTADAASEAAAAGGEGEKKPKKRRKSAAGSADAGSASVPEVPDAGAAEAAPPRRGGERVACTLFVGQLPYNSTAEEVKAYFLAVCSPPIHVRLLTHKTGGSRGMAFVELGSESDVHSALRLHHSCIYGRRINVERTVGGGNSGENRSTKLAVLREKQGAVVVKAVRDLVEATLPPAAEADNAGVATREDVDERALEFLTTVAPSVAEAAVQEIASLDLTGVKNRSAWLMGVLRRNVDESDSFAPPKDEGKGKGGKGGRGGGKGGKGGGKGGGRDGGSRRDGVGEEEEGGEFQHKDPGEGASNFAAKRRHKAAVAEKDEKKKGKKAKKEGGEKKAAKHKKVAEAEGGEPAGVDL